MYFDVNALDFSARQTSSGRALPPAALPALFADSARCSPSRARRCSPSGGSATGSGTPSTGSGGRGAPRLTALVLVVARRSSGCRSRPGAARAASGAGASRRSRPAAGSADLAKGLGDRRGAGRPGAGRARRARRASARRGGRCPRRSAPRSLVLLLSFVAPLLLEPLFNRFAPLADEELAATCARSPARAGVPVRDVLVADASRRTTKRERVRLRARRDAAASCSTTRCCATRRRRSCASSSRTSSATAATGTSLEGPRSRCSAPRRRCSRCGRLAWAAVAAAGSTAPATRGSCRSCCSCSSCSSSARCRSRPGSRAAGSAWPTASSLELTARPRDDSSAMHRRLALANLADLEPPRPVYLLLFSHPTPPERIARPPWGRT